MDEDNVVKVPTDSVDFDHQTNEFRNVQAAILRLMARGAKIRKRLDNAYVLNTRNVTVINKEMFERIMMNRHVIKRGNEWYVLSSHYYHLRNDISKGKF